MRKAIPFLVWAGAIAAALAALVGTAVYFLYVPPQPPPHLSGETINGRVRSGGLVRSYRVYLPGSLKLGAPLLMVLHGSMGSAQIIRTDTGYGFDRIADREGFAVAYPNGVDGYWNACNIVGGDTASIREIDDVGFLTALT
ncbi:MAG: polyhydroxybutyrate depolymerase, partial [Alphaproteobacteria bacterium]|nr:polyhydroxybutyrate depolymerase [Alphaproteobacteria bacterium]